MLNVTPEFEQRAADDVAVAQIVESGGRGAIALVMVATAIVIGIWFAFYAWVFLPRITP